MCSAPSVSRPPFCRWLELRATKNWNLPLMLGQVYGLGWASGVGMIFFERMLWDDFFRGNGGESSDGFLENEEMFCWVWVCRC